MTAWSRLAALILLIAVREVPSGSDAAVLEGTVHCPSEHPKVVFVEAGDLVSPPPPSAPAVFDQRGLEFIPRVLPVMVGPRVAFINSDTVLPQCLLRLQNEALQSRNLRHRCNAICHFRPPGSGRSPLQRPP